MAYTYKSNLTFSVAGGGDEHEPAIRIRYTVTPGSGDYWDGQQWQPGWAAEVEISTAEIEAAPNEWVAVPEWMFSFLYSDEALRDTLLECAAADDEAERDAAAERRAEDLRMGL